MTVTQLRPRTVTVRELRPGIAVLFTSGYPGEAIAGEGLPEEDAFIEKPFTPTKLAEKVREVLERASARRMMARLGRGAAGGARNDTTPGDSVGADGAESVRNRTAKGDGAVSPRDDWPARGGAS